MRLPNPFTTFRVQMVVFMTITLLVTILVLSLVNQRLERRTTSQVDEYIQAITLANDVVYQSFSSGTYLYELVNNPDRSSLVVNDKSIIRDILLVEEDGKVYDSTERSEIGRQLTAAIKDVPSLRRGDIKLDEQSLSGDQLRTMTSTLTTDKGKRTIVVVISMDRLQRVKDAVTQIRLGALVAMGLALIVLIAWYSRRATRPIAELAWAARRVASGDLDFQVPATRRDEIGTLSQTFNEMLADLRRKKELEEQLRRAEQSAVVGRLASGIAHEIRNPLNFINLSIDHLRAKFEPSGETAHILGMIKDEIGRLNRLVSDFLSYGRPARLKMRELDARVLIDEVVRLVSAQADEQGISINIRSEPDQPASVHGDGEQLKTCFSNLMINAIQAMPEGGSLTVTLKPDPDNLVIEFEDSGSGIEADPIEQIFEPYYSTKDTGIGLGLPLTKKIIEEHGGRIEATSTQGKGAKFIVVLPRENAATVAGPVS
ncbi:MAG: ATP-binding protein, partial [Acidobacteriota bacterium]